MMNTFISAFNDVELTYAAIGFILSIGLIISSLEELFVFDVYEDHGLLSWKVSKHGSPFFLKGYLGKKFSFILSCPQFNIVTYSKLLLSISLLLTSILKLFPPILILLILSLMLLTLMRSSYGLDGAYQMNLVVLFGMSISSLAGMNSKIASICLWFISGELILSYFIAGLTKLISPIWRNSHALPAIFSTNIYGHKGMFELVMKYKIVATLLTWPSFIFELLFIFALLSSKLCVFLCFIGFSFHFFNALFMGLNTFLFAFLSTYPALFYCCSKSKLLWIKFI